MDMTTLIHRLKERKGERIRADLKVTNLEDTKISLSIKITAKLE